jgi:hypothetical protein
VLRPGGHALFLAAAHQRLLSEHDRAVGSTRRFELAGLRALFAPRGAAVLRGTYLFAFLFPVVALYKLINKPAQGEKRSDVSTPAVLINEPLFWLCWLEAQILRLVNLFMGSSVAVLVKKHA